MTGSQAGPRQVTLLPALLKEPDHHLLTPVATDVNRSVGTQACLWKCGWRNSQRVVPQSCCSLSKLFPINYIVCPFRRAVSSPQTCLSLLRQSTCVFQPLGAFIFCFLPSHYRANQRSPLHPLHEAPCDFSLCDWHLINEEGLVSLSLQLWWVRGPQN